MSDEVAPLEMTPAVREVLAVLHARPGRKLSVRDIARVTRRSPGYVYGALRALGEAKLVQDSEPDRPPHKVYWPNQAGRDAATAFPASAVGTDREQPPATG
jgi:Fe2+ or Zn2+ uptake regulation protein